MNSRASLIVIGTLVVAGCASEPSRYSTLPPDHPANPEAPQAAFAVPANPLIQEFRVPAETPETTAAGGLGAQAAEDAGEHKHEHEKQADDHQQPLELDAQMQAQVDRLLAAYLSLADMLAKDQHEGTQQKVDELHKAAHALDEVEHDQMEELTGRIAEAAHGKAGDLKAARATFKAISIPVVELARIAPPTKVVGTQVHEAYCPMVKASWLQIAHKVANPYYGSEMPRCGKITRMIQSRDQKE